MKRSEMIELIAEHLISNCYIFGGDQDERNEVKCSTKMYRLKLANEMLKCSETLGMTPPGYIEVFASGEKYIKDLHPGRDTHYFKEWEPE